MTASTRSPLPETASPRPAQTWAAFEADSADIAAAVRRLLWIPGFGFGYLATVGRSGAPRIHPVDVGLAEGRLVTFIVSSPKRDDLRREPRFAIHATQSETINDEAAITGRAIEHAPDSALRAPAVAAMPFAVPDDHVLFELTIDTVLWAEYATPPVFPPRYHRWPPRGTARPDRSSVAPAPAPDLNHLYLRVRDVDASVAFYRDLLGFDGPSEWQGETLVVRNTAGFALALTPDPGPPAWPDGLHFGFVLDDVPRAKALRDRVTAAGVVLEEGYEEPGFVVCRFRDPDGYLLEIEAGVPVSPPPA
ncbi:MAG TPA: VOC family protein [Candidatus Limnocylindrales bacterium]|nr:VOC family protein [Candidatus Limnocylindrales bacterium]